MRYPPCSNSTISSGNDEKRRAAISSVIWSAVLTVLKLGAGVATGSLGIMSEALHSSMDFIAAGITFYAVRMAARPADDNHPYGHEKVENLSALAETALLVLTSAWIVWEALHRLFVESVQVSVTWWACAVVIISLIVDVNRSAMLRRVAKKHRSQALEADALHFTTDIWSSAVVLLGLVCVYATRYFAPEGVAHAWLHRADALAGLLVAGIILWVAWGLVSRSVHALMDGGSRELSDRIATLIKSNFPQYPILRLRVRDNGVRIFGELNIEAPATLQVKEAHDVADAIHSLISTEIQGAEITVHIEPSASNNE